MGNDVNLLIVDDFSRKQRGTHLSHGAEVKGVAKAAVDNQCGVIAKGNESIFNQCTNGVKINELGVFRSTGLLGTRANLDKATEQTMQALAEHKGQIADITNFSLGPSRTDSGSSNLKQEESRLHPDNQQSIADYRKITANTSGKDFLAAGNTQGENNILSLNKDAVTIAGSSEEDKDTPHKRSSFNMMVDKLKAYAFSFNPITTKAKDGTTQRGYDICPTNDMNQCDGKIDVLAVKDDPNSGELKKQGSSYSSPAAAGEEAANLWAKRNGIK